MEPLKENPSLLASTLTIEQRYKAERLAIRFLVDAGVLTYEEMEKARQLAKDLLFAR